jgi:hypothetical protein
MKRNLTTISMLSALSALLLTVPSYGQGQFGSTPQSNMQQPGCGSPGMMGGMGMGQMRGMRMQGMMGRMMGGMGGGMMQRMQGRHGQNMGGMGSGMMRNMGGMRGGVMQGMGGDMMTAHQLVMQHEQINRTVIQLPNGVETLTESDDAAVAAKIMEHVPAMYQRLKKNQPLHQGDPLMQELFRYGSKINAEVTMTPKGVRVVETSTDPYVVKLIKAHAKTVDALVKRGMEAMHAQHEVPKR